MSILSLQRILNRYIETDKISIMSEFLFQYTYDYVLIIHLFQTTFIQLKHSPSKQIWLVISSNDVFTFV